jgi:hypothetical protein
MPAFRHVDRGRWRMGRNVRASLFVVLLFAAGAAVTPSPHPQPVQPQPPRVVYPDPPLPPVPCGKNNPLNIVCSPVLKADPLPRSNR